MKGVVISVLVVLAMVQFMVKPGQAAVSCDQVVQSLEPCIGYLTSGGAPPTACCNGVANIKKIAQTTADKQAACGCAKDAAARIPAIKDDAASALPAKCNVQVDFPISRTIDCSTIH